MPMSLSIASYVAQVQRWPTTGRHILAHYDAESVIVYQAYRPAIGLYAATHQHFGGEGDRNAEIALCGRPICPASLNSSICSIAIRAEL